MDAFWQKSYPKGIRTDLPVDQYQSINEIYSEAIEKFSPQIAYTNMGANISFQELDRLTKNFASYLQNELGLKKGDRLAIQMPNLIQFPVVLFGAFRAGLIVTNINPMYTEREMAHQLKDSGAETIVIVANFASKLESIISETNIKNVIVTEVADLVPFPKSLLINSIVKHVKKMVPAFSIPGAVKFNKALAIGSRKDFKEVSLTPQDTAFLQYTGGTTGVAKGAELTHKNIVSNVMQVREWMSPILNEGEEILVSPLPLYHIFSLTVSITFLNYGAQNVLITNPRDMAGFIKELKKFPFTVMTGLNTLFNGLLHQEEFKKIDFSPLKLAIGGGMAMQNSVNDQWKSVTGKHVIEGYGLTESSPLLCCNPADGTDQIGTIGLPVPLTEIRIVGDNDMDVERGEAGEIWARGPQIMKGYWNRPEETAKTITSDGWLKTGDIAVMHEDGFLQIVDRKKDMILVSGFNVYPNELEDVVVTHEKVLEVAAIGVEDPKCGEVPKLFVVKKDESLTEEELLDFCKENLTGYKRPRYVEFMEDLPKSNVGKILRKDLRNK